MKSVLRPSCDDPRSIASGMIRRRVGLIELHHFLFSNHHDRYILQHVRSLSAPLSLVQPAISVKNHLQTKSMLDRWRGNDQQFFVCVCSCVQKDSLPMINCCVNPPLGWPFVVVLSVMNS